jgi:hypothetical protein
LQPTFDIRLSTFDLRLLTFNFQSSTLDLWPLTFNFQLSTFEHCKQTSTLHCWSLQLLSVTFKSGFRASRSSYIEIVLCK